MSDDLGGQPFPDGEEPEYRHHGAADDEFASVVFDEAFVRSAAVHEPTAVERILAAAQSHAESETARGFEDAYGYGPGGEGEFDPDVGLGPDADDDDEPDDEGRFDRSDYSEYVEPGDGDEPGHYGPYRPDGSYGPDALYGPESSYGSYGSYIDYGQYGHYRRYDPRFDVGEEHGSDHRPPNGRHARHGRHAGDQRPHRGRARWQRPIAWLLAVVMGIGMIALALSAVYRGTSGQRQDPAPPPATSGVDSTARAHDGVPGPLPSTSAQAGVPTFSMLPHEG